MPSMYILSNVILVLALSAYDIHILDMGNNMIRLTIFIHVLFAKKNGGI